MVVHNITAISSNQKIRSKLHDSHLKTRKELQLYLYGDMLSSNAMAGGLITQYTRMEKKSDESNMQNLGYKYTFFI